MLSLENLAQIHDAYRESLDATPGSFVLRGQRFDPHPAVSLMGVVNLSADSWYRESVSLTTETAIRRGKRLIADGANIVDIGAESTVLTAASVNSEAQRAALIPVIESLAAEDALVSVESYDLEVTKACFDAGAAILNLTSAQNTPEFYELAAAHDAGVIICYIQGRNARTADDFNLSEDHTGVLLDYFAKEIELAETAGVERIWIDPGLGFYYKNLQDSAQRVRYQINTFLSGFRLRNLGWPVCQALPHAFEYFQDEVRTAEPFFAVLAALGKTDLIRTHEVSRVRGVLKTMEAAE